MTEDLVLGNWIVHRDGSLSHLSCGMIKHSLHRTDGCHFCYKGGEVLVPIIVCEVLKIQKSIVEEEKLF